VAYKEDGIYVEVEISRDDRYLVEEYMVEIKNEK